MGIQWDLGGFRYVPCDMDERMSMNRFRFRGTAWNIAIDGAGPYASLEIDGAALPGTLQIPSELLGGSKLAVKRSAKPFARPTLLEAVDAELCGLKSSKTTLAFPRRRGGEHVRGRLLPGEAQADRQRQAAGLRLGRGQEHASLRPSARQGRLGGDNHNMRRAMTTGEFKDAM